MTDLGLVRYMRLMDIPLEALEALENWGRWQRQREGRNRSPGLEGKFRSNRCPACYEHDDPCDDCQRNAPHGQQIDMALALAVERAITHSAFTLAKVFLYSGTGKGRIAEQCYCKEQAILLAHFRGIRVSQHGYASSNPKATCRAFGIQIDEYDRHVANLVRMVWNRMKAPR